MPRTAAGNCLSVVSESADYIGTTALIPQRMLTGDVALTDTTIVSVPRDAMNIVVQQDPRLARQIGEAIEIRRKAASEALAEAAQGVRVASRLGQRKRRVGRVSIASMVVIEIRYQGRSSGRRGGIATDPAPVWVYSLWGICIGW
jgi:CRP-like cAMP-binding protein